MKTIKLNPWGQVSLTKIECDRVRRRSCPIESIERISRALDELGSEYLAHLALLDEQAQEVETKDPPQIRGGRALKRASG